MVRLLTVIGMMTAAAACSMKPTPTRNVREMAEALANPASPFIYDANDIRVTTLNQAFSNATYTCANHRHIHTNSGGRCPVCGFGLIPMPRHTAEPAVAQE